MDPTPSKKRKLEPADREDGPKEVDGDGNGATIQRGDIWYEDGNVVLVAEGKAFKVSWYIVLMIEGDINTVVIEVYREDCETYEGCPKVHIHDSAEDLACLLSALLDTTLIDDATILTIDEVSTMFRMGCKYQTDRVREKAVHRLKLCFPDNPDDYATPDTRSTLYYEADPSHYFANATIAIEFCDCATVIKLAGSHHFLDNLLPAAFYAYARMVYSGMLCTNETDLELQCSKEDVVRCLNGADALKKALRQNLYDSIMKIGRSDSCVTRAACKSKKLASLQELAALHLRSEALVDFGIVDKLGLDIQCCEPCLLYCKETYEQKRQQEWMKLREYFDLSPVIGNGHAAGNGIAA
ncbi:hypothetical protein EIP91_000490 [Steccherinum ochraceum]|uniref:BTB domain-containing protein n=1 Tax=Steccherinum ochraceum TaxID=92696 RepID=A0A4R0RUW5_9APHY|nr:hypothetical protein EIP91_000490 [Steccherinum ochraceum]